MNDRVNPAPPLDTTTTNNNTIALPTTSTIAAATALSYLRGPTIATALRQSISTVVTQLSQPSPIPHHGHGTVALRAQSYANKMNVTVNAVSVLHWLRTDKHQSDSQQSLTLTSNSLTKMVRHFF